MSYYVNYLDEKFEVSQEVLSKECDEIFGNIRSLEGYRTKANDSNRSAIIYFPIFFLLLAILIIIANLFLFKQGENFIVNMIFIPLELILFGVGVFCYIIYKKDKTYLDDFYIEKRNLDLKVFINIKNKIFVYSTTLFGGKIGEMIMYKNGVKKIIVSDTDSVNAFANYYVESIYLIEKFFTECKNAKYRKSIQVEDEITLIVYNDNELILNNNVLDKMILSYNETVGVSSLSESTRHIFMNIKTINGNAKPLHFQNLN